MNIVVTLEISPFKKNRLISMCAAHKEVFDYTLKRQILFYKKNKTFEESSVIIKDFTRLKKNKLKHLSRFSAQMLNISIRCATSYFINELRNNVTFFKTSEPIREKHFFINTSRMKIELIKNSIVLEKLGEYKVREPLKEFSSCKIIGGKVFFDNKNKLWCMSLDMDNVEFQ